MPKMTPIKRSLSRLYPAIVGSAIGVILILSNACSKTEKVSAEGPVATEQAPTVAVAKVTVADLSHAVTLTAEFRPFQEIDVMAKVSGYVKEIKVDAGDRVRQGQLLATLEIPEMADDLARAKAALSRSESEVARARDEIQRAEAAHSFAHVTAERLATVNRDRPGLVAQQEIDDARGKDLISESQIAGAKSSLESAIQQVAVNRAELARVNTMFEYTKVVAPFTGVITKRFADQGSMIQAGTASQTQAMPLVRLSENTLLRLILPVPESAVPDVKVGQTVDVRVPSLNRTFPGRVARFAGKVQFATRTMDTEVDVPNSSLVLVPGMYAEVDLTLKRHQNAVAAPVAAVDADEDSGSGRTTGRAMVVTADHRVEIRKLTLGIETANLVEIREGLAAGEMLVVGNRSSLQDHQLVQPKITQMTAAKP